MVDARVERADALMTGFAERTGLTSAAPQRRYLWTDAFAVCNFIGLRRATRDPRHDELAATLVHLVHHELGRHRLEDPRSGWLSGLDEAAGEAHPTLGGLRIGKPLPERAPAERVDDELEWDRDGQYFHYLTKWMVALDHLARATRDPRPSLWARELADTAHRRFTYTPAGAGGTLMYWKMTVDLTRAVVPAMGQHDPLDGLITCLELDDTADAWGSPVRGPDLAGAIADFAGMIQPTLLATPDPLGIGSLLVDAHRCAHLLASRTRGMPPRLLEALLASALLGMRHISERSDLRLPAQHRLAFRELGLSIGLAALASMPRDVITGEARTLCTELERYAPLREAIELFWIYPEHQMTGSWTGHAEINEVMLATSLVPEGFLVRPPLAP